MILVYDIEVFPNYFCISFKEESGAEHSFVITVGRNELRSLLIFLSNLTKNGDTLVGFNNIGYDYPVIEPLLSNWKHIWNRFGEDPERFNEYIYNRSKDIIESESDEWYKKYYTNEFIIPQIDLYKIYHLDNKHKTSVSLKWIEFVIGHDLLQTFDFDPENDLTIEEQDEVLLYNLNDVRATFNFYNTKTTQSKLNYRSNFGYIENLSLTNLSDTSISKKLFAKYLMDSMGISYWELKELRTNRSKINFKDIIFPYVKFETPLFRGLLETIKGSSYNPNSDESTFSYSVEHCGLHFDYGVGGLHAYPKKWVIGKNGQRLKDPVSIIQDDKSDDTWQIIHVDVSSYYPNIAINNNLKPAHLGDEFIQIYKDFYNRRYEAKKAGQYDVEQAMKLSLNSVFGLSNERFSYFYDPQFAFTITVNGQLLLTMLAEQFCLHDIKLLQCNTDGIYVKIKKDQFNTLKSLCDDWCKLTNLNLDFDYYDRLCQRDVNNYIGLTSDGKVKHKGAFRIDKQIHEDASMRIVPMALEQYLLYDVDYRQYIKSVSEIQPFMMGLKIKKRDLVQERFLDETKTQVETRDYSKAVRYIVSKNGNPLYKQFGRSGLDQKVHAGYKCKIANDLSTISREDVDEVFYIKEIEKIASLFNRQQLSLSLF